MMAVKPIICLYYNEVLNVGHSERLYHLLFVPEVFSLPTEYLTYRFAKSKDEVRIMML